MRKFFFIVVCIFALTGFKTGQHGSIDIRYGFESVEMNSGPDTFELFEATSSDVSLSSQYAFRGSYSLHVQDKVGNGSFPEFQGYFPAVSRGTLEIGFALMTPDPSEPFNIAFAGQQHFRMVKDGMGLWLFNDSGTLRHMSDSMPKRLLDLVAYQWYWFEIELDLSNGQYSLLVVDESGREITLLDQQAHPTNSKESELRMYSFAGDLADKGNGNFYIDEFVLRTEYADSPQPMIAPGRRTLFVDQWNEYHKKIGNLDFCIAPKLPYDFIDIYNTQGLQTLQDNTDALRTLLDSPSIETLDGFDHDSALITGISQWAEGCVHLSAGRYSKAVENLELAEKAIGNSLATQLNLAMAYAKTNQFYVAQSIVSSGQMAWPDDVRWLVLSAAIGFISGRAEDSESALSTAANSLEAHPEQAKLLADDLGWLTNPAVKKLRHQQVWNEQAEGFVIAEQYYFSLLWQNRFREAESYATEFSQLLESNDLESPLWHERIGDAALFEKRFSAAERNYKKALKLQKGRMSTLQKLADVYFLQGRVSDERQIRESIFGALNYE